jgi:hypothetical protein
MHLRASLDVTHPPIIQRWGGNGQRSAASMQ